jgi:hypothetical protein
MKRILILLSVLSFFTLNPGYVEAGGGKAPAIPPLTITPSTKDVFYVNQKIKFTASGGTTPYTFTANIGTINKTTGDYTAPASAGTSRVTVTDKKGNTATYNAPVYFYLGITPTTISVPTESNNTSFSGTGGMAPYKYSTNNGTVSSNGLFTAPKSPGSAVVTVTDSRNNKVEARVTIYQSLGINPPNKLMMVGSSFTFTGTGGIPPYTYSSTDGKIGLSNGLYSPISVGNYRITAMDSTKRTSPEAPVTVYPKLVINPPSKIMVVGGTQIFTATGGYGKITFSEVNNKIDPTTGFFTAPSKPSTEVVATDSQGNRVVSPITINPELDLKPPVVYVPLSAPQVNFVATGGISPLTFSSTFGNIDSKSGIYTVPSTSGLSTITVVDTRSPAVSRTASVCVYAPLKIFPDIKTVVKGKILTLTASEGCKPYTFTTDFGTIATNKSLNNTTGSFSAPNPGTAIVTVTDAAGKTAKATITVSSYLALTPPPLTMPINDTHLFTPSGGVPPYTFKADKGDFPFPLVLGKYKAPGNETTDKVYVTDDDKQTIMSSEICVYEPLQIFPERVIKGLIVGDILGFTASHGCIPYRFSKDKGQIDEGSGAYTATELGKAKITVSDFAQKSADTSLTVYAPLSLNSYPGTLQLGKSFTFTATGGIPDLSWAATPGDIDQNGRFTPTTKGLANIVVTDGAFHNKNATIMVYEELKISPPIKTLAINDNFKFTISGGYFGLDKMVHVLAGRGSVDENGNYTAPAEVGDGKDTIMVKDSAGNHVSAELIIRPALSINPPFANLEVNEVLPFEVTGGVGNYSYISSMFRRDFDLNGNFRPIKSGTANITVTDEGGHSVTATVNVYDPLEIKPKDKVLVADDSFDRFTATGGVPGSTGYMFNQDIGLVDPKTGFFKAPIGPLEAPVTGSVWVTDSLGKPVSANITINPSLSLLPAISYLQVGRERALTIKGGIGNYNFDTPSKGQITASGVFKAPTAGSADPVEIIVRDSAIPSKHSAMAKIYVYDELQISPLSISLIKGEFHQFLITGGLLPRFPITDDNLKGSIDPLTGLFSAIGVGDVKIIVTDSETIPLVNRVEATVHVFPELSLNPPTANVQVGENLPFTIIGGIGPSYSFDLSPNKGTISSSGLYTAPPEGPSSVAGPVDVTVWDEGRKHSFTAHINVYDKLKIDTVPTERKDLAVNNSVPLLITGGIRKDNKYKFIEANLGSFNTAGDYVAPSDIGGQTSVQDIVKVTDYEGNSATVKITIHPALTISPSPAIMAVNRTLNFQASNGVPTYSYSVKEVNGQIRNLTTGSYTATTAGIVEVTAHDILGNTATSVVTVNGEIEINPKNIVLVKGGTKSFTARGGVGILVFSVSNGNGSIDPTTGNFTALNSGDVEVIVTDSEGVAIKIPAKVKVYDPLKISPTEKNLAVSDTFKFEITGGYFSGLDKMIHVTVGKGQIDENGNYTAPADAGDGKDIVTVKDSDGNIVTANVYINTALAISPKKENLLVNGKLPFTVSGGVAPYTYNSSNGSIFSNKSVNNTIGNFTAPSSKDDKVIITVTDNAQPAHVVTAEVNVYEPLKISPPDKVLALGNKFNFEASGGVPGNTGYVFGFERKIGEIITDGNLGKYSAPPLGGDAGTGIITLRDSINNLVMANIGINTTLAVNPPDSLPVNSNLNFNTIVSGGIPGYSYSKPNFGTIDTSGNYHALSEGGNEEITITDTDGISVVARFCVFKPLTISPNSKILVAKDTQTFEAQEGCKPYKFEYAGGIFDFVEGANSGLFRAPDSAGIGTVKVIDNVGHNVTANITINPSLAITPPSANLVVKGKLNFTVSGGIAPFTYISSVGTIATNKSVNNTTGYFTAPSIKDDKVIITVTDNAQPAHTITASVNVYDSLKITTEKNEIAVGDTINYVIEGGFGSYSVVSVGGTRDDENRQFTAVTADTDLVKGSVSVTDQGDPVNSATANIKINPALTISSNKDKVKFGNTLNFSANGGVGTRTFSVEAGQGSIDPSSGLYSAPNKEIGVVGTATISVTDTANHKKSITISIYAPLEITLDHYDLAVTNETHYHITGGFGSYEVSPISGDKKEGDIYKAPGQVPSGGKDTIKVVDGEANEATVEATIHPALKIQPSPATMAVGRSLQFLASDGVGPTYSYSVKEVNGEERNLFGGNYTATTSGQVEVTARDGFGNTVNSIVTVKEAIQIDPPSTYLAISVGGKINNKKFNARGGVGTLVYSVPTGQGVIDQSGNYTSPDSKGLVYITVTDDGGPAFAKTAMVNVYIPVKIDPTEKILVAGNPFDFTASEGAGDLASIGIISGSGPYSFTSDAIIGSILTNGNRGSFTTVPIAGVPQNGITAKVFVSDSLALPGEVASATVTVNPALSLDPKPAFLAKDATYNFGASTHGGIPPYTYEPADKFSNGGIYTASSSGGTVTISVRDSVNTSVTATFCVYAPIEFDPPGAKILAKDNTFTFRANEGCKPYKFNSSNPSVGSINIDSGFFTALNPGSADITVTDASNQNSAQIHVTVNPKLSIEPQGRSIEVSKSGTPSGLIFTAHDGVPPYRSINLGPPPKGTIVFGGGVTANYTAPLSPGSDVVIVTDDFGNTAQATVSVYGPLAISPPELQNIEVGSNPAKIFTASGGVKNYSFSLSNAVGTITPSGTTTGDTTSYDPKTKGQTQLILTDSATPPNSKRVDINVYDPLSISPSTNQNIGKANTLHFTAKDGLPGPTGYAWSVSSGGNLVKSADGLSADFSAPNITVLTVFTVTVTDSANTYRSINVGVYPPITIDPKAKTLAVQGNATFTASGGTGSYVWSKTIGSIDQEGIFSALNNPGTGKVIVTDKVITTLSDSADVTITPKFTLIPEVASVEVNDNYSFMVSGGVAPFSFTIDGGASKGTLNPSGSFSTTTLIYTAPGTAGSAVIRGSDSLGNTTVSNVTIYSGIGISPPSKTMALNSTATFTATGGTPPFTWSKDKGIISPSGTNNINGNYTFSEFVMMANVTVTDNKGKSATAIITGDFPNNWIWANGAGGDPPADPFNQGGKFGTEGVPGTDVYPGARSNSAAWGDNNGNLWLTSGIGYASAGQTTTSLLYYLWKYDTKTNMWTAVRQNPTTDGTFGTINVENKDNYPGARYGATTWLDSNGRDFWYFGGYGYADVSGAKGLLNDLWKYNPTVTTDCPKGCWTWIAGSSKVYPTPNSGSGFTGYPQGDYGTSTAVPGGRVRASAWRDSSGNLWLFGGNGFDGTGCGSSKNCTPPTGNLNDLWKFQISNKKWVFMGGSTTFGQAGSYTGGTKYPGAREASPSWVDSNGKFWLFGGSSSSTSFFNDLWKYDPVTASWSWIKGSSSTNQLGVYGTKGEAASANTPGSRDRAAGFTDSKGNIWLFGGYGYGETGTTLGYMNDLWRLNVLSANPQWVYEGGEKVIGLTRTEVIGHYGTKGVGAADNWPGGRSSSIFFKASDGKFWFFGGSRTRLLECTSSPCGDYYNDLWKFFPE